MSDIPTRLMVVVAHPDDETFGCGSLLLHARAAGAATMVCCASRGEAGESTDASPPHRLGPRRETELRDAAALLGVGRVELLGFTDSGMSGPAGPHTVAGAPAQRLAGSVLAAMRSFQPDVVVTLDGSDGHRDHVAIRDATIAAAGELAVPRMYLHCLPRSLMRRWVDHMRRARPDIAHLDGDTDGLGTPDHRISTVIDVSAHLARREQAIAVHVSQTSPFDGLPDQLRRDFLATDHARRIIPPWTGGPPETSLVP